MATMLAVPTISPFRDSTSASGRLRCMACCRPAPLPPPGRSSWPLAVAPMESLASSTSSLGGVRLLLKPTRKQLSLSTCSRTARVATTRRHLRRLRRVSGNRSLSRTIQRFSATAIRKRASSLDARDTLGPRLRLRTRLHRVAMRGTFVMRSSVQLNRISTRLQTAEAYSRFGSKGMIAATIARYWSVLDQNSTRVRRSIPTQPQE